MSTVVGASVLAHGLHAAMVLLGLWGLGALLLPQAREHRARRSPRRTAPAAACLDEHARRVTALRVAAASGTLATLRRNYGALMEGAALVEDLRMREQQALELNDSVLQGLVVAKMALDLDDPHRANAALDTSIASASRIITNLLGSEHFNIELLRSAPAVVDLNNRITTLDSQEKQT